MYAALEEMSQTGTFRSYCANTIAATDLGYCVKTSAAVELCMWDTLHVSGLPGQKISMTCTISIWINGWYCKLISICSETKSARYVWISYIYHMCCPSWKGQKYMHSLTPAMLDFLFQEMFKRYRCWFQWLISRCVLLPRNKCYCQKLKAELKIILWCLRIFQMLIKMISSLK